MHASSRLLHVQVELTLGIKLQRILVFLSLHYSTEYSFIYINYEHDTTYKDLLLRQLSSFQIQA